MLNLNICQTQHSTHEGGKCVEQVYEYMDSDLECLIRDRATIISPADVKSYMQMVLQSLLACKQHWVLHRDIKPSNFLISVKGGAHRHLLC